MTTWQELYRSSSGYGGQPVSNQNQITQTRDQFLAKYANAVDANGRFIPGKANLWFDGEKAADVYDQLIGKQSVQTRYGDPRDGISKEDTFFNPEVNMDWIEDPRSGGGWASMKGAVLPGLAATAAILGGQALLGTGLAGGSAAGGSSAFGGAGSITGANVLGAGDLALTAMPQVTASSLGLTGAQAAGLGAAGSGSSLVNGIKSLNDMTGGNLGAIAGGLLGAAASGDTTTSTNRDPWGPAQGYLKDNLATNANMQKYYQANPFSQEQQSAYQGLLNTNANNQANAPIMQANANSFMQSKRGAMPAMQGLLSGTQAAPIDWSKYANIGKG